MFKVRFVGGIACMVATMAGCGVATASPHANSPVPSEPTLINYVDPSMVRGLSTRSLNSGEAAGRRVHATYPAVADAPRLTEKLFKTVTASLARFAGNDVPAGALPNPEFNVDWQLAAASPEVLGVRLRIGQSMGSGWSESRTTLWYDRANRRALESPGLIRDSAALTTLAGIVRRELALRGPLVNPNALRPERSMFDSLGFNPRGDLVVEFDDKQVGLGVAGRVAVAVPSATAAPLLSETGLRARRASVGTATLISQKDMLAASMDRPAARSSKAGTVDCAKARCVALTYEDGPGPETGRLLNILGAYRARATFFTLGSNASARPELLRRMRDEGHLVANHTWSHRDLSVLSSAMLADQLTRAQHAIVQAIGQVPTLMRPPYGGTDEQVTSVARRLGMSVVRWSVDAEDRDDPDPRAIARRTVSQVRPGSIVLMRDFRPATVDAAPAILRELAAKGYTFVTVPELYGPRAMEPGRTYDSGTMSNVPDRRSMS
ncbi:polysaccharide deacetylase family protein [Streptosporangium sp. NPDC002721]|uniref:polysaccharide deacetylase family protein n=1 Tax=Streptosporangium sp. NPDC002721 TaxID=3366188 RepID=UPI0036AAA681